MKNNNEIISINDYVTVTLTDEGAKVLNTHYEQMVRLYPQLRDIYSHIFKSGEVLEEQLWQLMRDFGEHVGAGKWVVFTDFQIGEHKEEREKK